MKKPIFVSTVFILTLSTLTACVDMSAQKSPQKNEIDAAQILYGPGAAERDARILAKKQADYQRVLAEQEAKYGARSSPQPVRDSVPNADRIAIAATKKRLLADGKISIAEIPEVLSLIQGYLPKEDAKDFPKIGLVALTNVPSASTQSHKVKIIMDKGFSAIDLGGESEVLEAQKNLDFIVLVGLTSASVERSFKNKRESSSQYQSGTQQEGNPAYGAAFTEYQQALADFKNTKIDGAINSAQPCGNALACLLGGALRVAADGAAERDLREKANLLAATPKTITKPVYSNYSYSLVDISETKVAKISLHLIDVKNKQFVSKEVPVKAAKDFSVPYGIRESDPAKYSLLAKFQTEADVDRWEREILSVGMSALVKEMGDTAQPKPLKNVDGLIASTKAKTLAVYAGAVDTSQTSQPLIAGVDKRQPMSQQSGTVSDDRFSSVVIIKTQTGSGAGFYVASDLILSAQHVVAQSGLVEITFYDGEKGVGKVVDHDARLDLTLIQTQRRGTPVKIYQGPLKLGAAVEAIGHPRGYDFTITRGVVSALRKQTSSNIKIGAPVEYVQTDTPISPGNSGGPLFLGKQVIGVNDWIRTDAGSQNLNFSVSFNEIRTYLDGFSKSSRPQ